MDKEIRNGSESKNIPKILSECFLVLSEHYADLSECFPVLSEHYVELSECFPVLSEHYTDLSNVNAPWEVSFRIG